MPRTTDFPDARRGDAATVLVSPWLVPAAALQRAAADSVLAEWERQKRPDAMLALTTFLSTDGSHVLNYAQWTDDGAHREWARTVRPAAVGRIDAAVTGIRRPGLTRYRRHRSHVPEGPGPRPALLVTPAFATTGPDAQRALADTVVGTLDREPVPGLLGVHVHLSQDGARVLLYQEWAGASAWRESTGHGASARLRATIEALEGVSPTPAVSAAPASADPPTGEHPDAPETRDVPDAPGLPDVPQYRLHASLLNIPATAAGTAATDGRQP
ncbi:antibiotic biosynthesis monooxygenase [Streptomyces sp. MCA2]|uniref:antibiotic biosynthesis monooxygenase n=1 Tax=Streptomyces sp. MCA2 TaxID=2944805 RepID=UPI0020220908|nr:antibiotic biosynthesis monooxygenase [Streptomyces sp. MCA2]MCL7492671.1 antibiotic biosynthesis monooxygenase [Streptomyces sp. MCA2]